MAEHQTGKVLRCAVYTRKSSDEGLEQAFNTLHAQREACEAYILSQKHEGWQLVPTAFDDGGFSGGSMDRPGLKALLHDVTAGLIDIIVVYKVDRLTRSLADFAKMVELFDAKGASFVSVTQAFNTTTSMGRLTLNVLLSFAQFEREVTGERIRDKIAASKAKGMWMGGLVPLGYDADGRTLKVNETEAEQVRKLFALYCKHRAVDQVVEEAGRLDIRSKVRNGRFPGGGSLGRSSLYRLLANPIYAGEIGHGAKRHKGLHEAIVERRVFDKVQRILAENRRKRLSGEDAAHPALLSGIVFDEQGGRLVSTHTRRRGRRYRYYAAVETGRRECVRRIPAFELEEAVCDGLVAFLRSPKELTPHLLAAGADLGPALEQARQLAGGVEAATGAALRDRLLQLVGRVSVGDATIAVDARGTAILANADGGEIRISIPASIAWRKGKLNLVLAAGPEPVVDQPLLAMVAQGRCWFDALVSGAVPSVAALARVEGLTRSYVGRMLPLAFLAPDIVEAIAEGRQAEGLTAATQLVGGDLAANWIDQRAALVG